MANIDIKYDTIPILDTHLLAAPAPTNGVTLLHQVPLVPNGRHEILSVDIVCMKQLAIDATDTVLVNTITPYDASAAADAAVLFTGGAAAAGDLKAAGMTALKNVVRLYSGRYSLEAGDSIRAILATVSPDTAGQGYFFIVGYRVRDYNGQ